jgi:streptogramin lyase
MAVAALALALPAGASADAIGANTEYSAPTEPTFPMTLVEGSDGNMWFTDPGFPVGSSSKIGKVTPGGEVTEYTPLGISGYPWGIAKGSDGDIWFTEPGAQKVGHIDPSEPEAAPTEISVPGMPAEPLFRSHITAGPDGNLWVALGSGGIARITPAGALTEYPTSTEGFKAGADVCSVAAGPDGNVWFGDCGTTKAVGRITPAGAVTEFEVVGDATNQPTSIAAGSDGRLWFPANNAVNERLGAITTAGVVSYYKTPTSPEATTLGSLTAGPDGNVWATEAFGQNEQQTVTLTATDGTYKLEFEGQKTGWTGTGNTTNEGTATQKKTITGVSTLTGKVAKGELITGAGIPAESVVVSCTPSNCESPTSIVMTKEATAKATGVSLSADLTVKPASTAANVREALGKLSTIGGNANVSVGAIGSNRSVSFTGKFERADVPLLVCDGTNLTGGTCSVGTTLTAVTNKLFRIKPATGAITPEKGFSLKSQTLLQSFTRSNALAAGPGGNLWYTSIGTPRAIGKFGVEANPELTVVKEGTGNGTVVSSPAGIECGGTCSAEFTKNGKVTLTASPDSESLFTSWKGCEVGGAVGRQCTVTMDKAKTVNAKFTKAYDVTVSRKGTGLGKVGSSPGGVLCLSNCSSTSAAFKELTNVTLTATPSKHFTFEGWSGDCTGTGTCVLSSLSADKAVEAEFKEVAKFDLTVTKKGGGQGTVKAKQAGINCGAVCSSMAAKYYEGEVIELLVPVPGKGSTFAGWSGAGCSGTGTCLVTMSSAKSVEAEFK